MGFFSSFSKLILLIVNTVFLLFGIAVIGIGAWILVDFSAILKYFPPEIAEDQALIQGAGIACVCLGVFVFLTSLFGCFGAMKEQRTLLGIFAVIMIVIFGGVLTGAIITLVHQEWVSSLVLETLNFEVDKNITNGLLKLAYDEFHCCGVLGGGPYNITCDQTYWFGADCLAGSALCENGCYNAIWDNWFAPYINIAVIFLFILAGVIALETVMAFCVCNKPHHDGYH